MGTTVTEKISLRISMGCALTAEWKMLTNASSAWKQMQILPQEQRDLFIVNHKGKEYIAFTLDSAPLTIETVQQYTAEFRKKLQNISPKHDVSKVPVCLFAQLFVA